MDALSRTINIRFITFVFYKQNRIPCGFRCDEAAHVNPAEHKRMGHESERL